MPIRDYPFSIVGDGPARPMLWVRLTNPDTGLSFEALATVDTGADVCVFPAGIATVLGHRLQSVAPNQMGGVGGGTCAWPHTSKVEILNIKADGTVGSRVLYTASNILIDFSPTCPVFLLGTKNFLSNFVLTVDYYRQTLSLRKPK